MQFRLCQGDMIMYLMHPKACYHEVYAVKPVEKFLKELGNAAFQIHEA